MNRTPTGTLREEVTGEEGEEGEGVVSQNPMEEEILLEILILKVHIPMGTNQSTDPMRKIKEREKNQVW